MTQHEPPSLNLTPERGPSVWHELHKEPAMSPGQYAAIAGGALLIASSVRRRSNRDAWIAALGMGCIAGALFYRRPLAAISLRLKQSRQSFDALDQTLDDSFPASDPPSSMQPV
jgi:hypothetical protein